MFLSPCGRQSPIQYSSTAHAWARGSHRLYRGRGDHRMVEGGTASFWATCNSCRIQQTWRVPRRVPDPPPGAQPLPSHIAEGSVAQARHWHRKTPIPPTTAIPNASPATTQAPAHPYPGAPPCNREISPAHPPSAHTPVTAGTSKIPGLRHHSLSGNPPASGGFRRLGAGKNTPPPHIVVTYT
jgi:hypothetical protein